MGCGGSKFDSEAETVSARIRPLLLRRLEEMRSQRRINGASLKKSRTGTSKKELLKDGVSDCDTVSSPPHDFDGKSNLSQEDNQKVAPEEKTMPKNVEPDTKAVKDASMLKSMKVAPSPQPEKLIEYNSNGGYTTGMDAIPKASVYTGLKAVNTTMQVADKQGEEREGDDDHNDISRLSSINADSLCPGSPSFRVYFIESLANVKDDNNNHGKHFGKIHTHTDTT